MSEAARSLRAQCAPAIGWAGRAPLVFPWPGPPGLGPMRLAMRQVRMEGMSWCSCRTMRRTHRPSQGAYEHDTQAGATILRLMLPMILGLILRLMLRLI